MRARRLAGRDADVEGDIAFHWRLSTPPDTDEITVAGPDRRASYVMALLFGIPALFGATSLILARRLRRRATG